MLSYDQQYQQSQLQSEQTSSYQMPMSSFLPANIVIGTAPYSQHNSDALSSAANMSAYAE